MKTRIALVTLLAAVFALMTAGGGPRYGLSRVEAQTPGFFGATRAPAIAVDKSDKLYVAMSVATKDASAGTPGSQIFFTKSVDGGARWDNLPQTRNLSKSKGEAFGPAIVINQQGTVRAYIVYHDNSNGSYQAHLIRSKKKTKFKNPNNITPHNGGAFSPRIALGTDETLNIVWGDTNGGGRKVVFLRSTDLGVSFSEPVEVSQSSGEAFEPEIAVTRLSSSSGEAINVVWEDNGAGASAIMFSRSTDGGQTFSAPVPISKEGRATEAHIAATGSGILHFTWVNETVDGRQAFYSRSTDGGQSFSAPVNVSNEAGAEIEKPFIAAKDNTVYVAYQDNKKGNKQVFLAKSEDGGLSFLEPEQVSQANNANGRAHSPSIAFDSTGKLHIVFIDASVVLPGKDEGILFYRNTSNGRRFSAQQMLIAAI